MNPDCRDGKHDSCSGDGWDEDADRPDVCPCPCHDPDHDNVHMSLAAAEQALDSLPVLEGVIVEEGMRIRPPTSTPCDDGLHTRCSGLLYDLLSLQDMPCECNCHIGDRLKFSAGGYISNPPGGGREWEFTRER